MRKIFTSLKSVVCVALVACMMTTAVTSCSYDDRVLKDEIEQIKSDLAALKDRVAALEEALQQEVDALTALINGKTVVLSVETKDGNTVVNLSDGSSFTVYGECDTVDTNTTLAPAQHTDGVYYWAVYNHGEFAHFLEVDGAYVPVFAEDAELVFDVDEATGNLLVSVDGGKTFVDSGIAAESEACVVSDVVVNENGTVTLVLADGSEVVVAMAELIEFDVRGALYVKAGESKTVSFEAGETVTDVEVMNQPYGWKAVVAENTLTVTAPKTELVALGAAEKSGLVSLHINTASGACKVAKLQVNFAELSLEVAKDGAITVKNSLVQTFMTMDWETWMQVEKTDFVSWTLGVCFYDDYVRAGSIQNVFNSYDIDYWTINDENFAYSGFEADQFSYNKVPYQEGVVDELVFTSTVENVVNALTYGAATYEGESFVVFVVPMDMVTYNALYDEAQVAEFLQLSVKAEVVKPSFNDVTMNVTLRGAQEYQLVYSEAKYIDQQIEYGYTHASYYDTYFMYWIDYGMDWGQNVIREDVFGEYTLYELMNYGQEWPMNVNLAPNTEYEFAILPVEEGRDKSTYSFDDVKVFRFTTSALVEATTPAEVTIEGTTDYSSIKATVTVPETIVAAYSAWYDSEFVYSEEAFGSHISSAWCKTDFSEGYTYELSTSGLTTGKTKYLVLVAVDAAGNYTLVQQAFTTKTPVLNENYTLGVGEYKFADGKLSVALTGIDGAEVEKYRYYLVNVNYYSSKSNDAIQSEMAISTDWRYQEVSGDAVSNPVIIDRALASYSYESPIPVGKTYKFAIVACFADGTISNTVILDEVTYELEVIRNTDERWTATKPTPVIKEVIYESQSIYWELSYDFECPEGVTVYPTLKDAETMLAYAGRSSRVAFILDSVASYWNGSYSGYANNSTYDLYYTWSDAEGNYYEAEMFELESYLVAE